MFDFKNASKQERQAEYNRIAGEIGDDRFFTRKELNHLPDVLAEREQVLAFSSGMMGGNTWLIVLTDRRVLFLDKGMFYGLKQISVDLDKVNAVSCQTGLMFGKIVVQDGATEHVIEMVAKKTVAAFTNRMRDTIDARKYSSRTAHAGDDVLARLERLGALREKGILTQSEFEAQKAKIIGTI